MWLDVVGETRVKRNGDVRMYAHLVDDDDVANLARYENVKHGDNTNRKAPPSSPASEHTTASSPWLPS